MLCRFTIVFFLMASLASGQRFRSSSYPYLDDESPYSVEKFPPEITEYRMQSIRVFTRAEMVFGKLPKHPKIIWLEQSNRRIADNLNLNSLDFVVTAPGLLEFPPIPVVLENKEFFIRPDDVQVSKNTASKTDSRLIVFWNELNEPPKEVHLGEAVDIRYVELIKRNERQNPFAQSPSRDPFNRFMMDNFRPSSRVNGGQWHQFIEIPGRRAYPEDFFFSYARSFWDGGNVNYESGITELDGTEYNTRSYKARVYFTEIGTATGHLGATLGTSPGEMWTHVIPFQIEVLPLPPLPNDRAIDTGLVGRWEFQSYVTPETPVASEPLKIWLNVSGKGNPKLRNKLDFSGEGFPAVESRWRANDQRRSDYAQYDQNNYEVWEATFEQSLIPTGKVGTLPARTIAYFDTEEDKWQIQEVTPALTLPGFTDVVTTLSPRTSFGKSITRPVLLNLPAATFGAFALAPLLPFLFGLVRKKLDSRDPALEARKKKLNHLIKDFQSGNGSVTQIDDQLLPLLREHLRLPSGATAREVADALSDEELATLIREHAESSFSANSTPVDLKALASQLAKLSLLFLICLSSLKGATLEEANDAFSGSRFTEASEIYEKLIEEHPGSPSLYFNLAQARLSADDSARARAACHTALLLDPLNKEANDLMSEIRKRQGDETVAGSRFLALRPDQWFVVAAVIWVGSFLYLGFRKFRPLPLWPGLALVALALFFIGTGAWKQIHTYADDQFMVIADELPREPEAGTPNWDYPPLRAGQIVQVTEVTPTHGLVSSSENPFWLPIHQLQQVW